MKRVCLDCKEPIKGRMDKKFCDDGCRSSYHRRLLVDDLTHVKQINQILKKNRKILKEKNPDGKIKIKRKQLLVKGFNFDYQTHMYTNKKGSTYFFCYEYGYLNLGEDVLLVKWEENE